MKTTRSLDLKVAKLTRAVNMLVGQVTSAVACAGFENTSQYKDSGLTTAQIAAVLDYGSPSRNIPARPFMENAITRDGKRRLNKIYRKHLSALFRDELESIKYEYADFSRGQNPRYAKRAVKAMMQELAETLYNNIFQSISTSNFEKLSEIYQKRTGKTKFLDGSTEFVEQISAWVWEDV